MAHAGLIISNEGIAEEVQKFIKEQSRSLGRSIYAIAGEGEARNKVPSIVNEMAMSAMLASFKGLFGAVEIDPTAILNEWCAKRRLAA